MKEYLLLYRSPYNHYYPTKNNIRSGLWDLNEYYLSDYNYYNDSLFTKNQNYYKETIIINDVIGEQLFIVIQDHDIENHIADDDRSQLTNEFNSCKISYSNFIFFRERWLELKRALPPFAIIYRNNNDWIDCKGFESQEAMELFVKNYVSQ